jgi:hypothetical protein
MNDEMISADFGRRKTKPTTCCRSVTPRPATTHFFTANTERKRRQQAVGLGFPAVPD